MAKIQFNATTGKDFRVAMGKYYDAMHALNDEICRLSVIKANCAQIIATDTEQLARLEKGDKVGIIRDKSTIQAELTEYTAKLAERDAQLESARSAQKKACEDAEKFVTENLYKAYQAYCADFMSDSALADYSDAIAVMLRKAGFPDADACNCLRFARTVGFRMLKGKSACKAESLVGAKAFKTWRTEFLAFFVEYLCEQKIVSKYKYAFVIEDKRKKNQ